MTTTTLRAELVRLIAIVRALPWASMARTTWTTLQLLAAGLVLLAEIAYEHRQQIRSALVTAIAALVVAAQLTYEAGIWTRRHLLELADRSATLLPRQPFAAVAPITASIEALREALARLIARLYPEVA